MIQFDTSLENNFLTIYIYGLYYNYFQYLRINEFSHFNRFVNRLKLTEIVDMETKMYGTRD